MTGQGERGGRARSIFLAMNDSFPVLTQSLDAILTCDFDARFERGWLRFLVVYSRPVDFS